MPIAQPTLYWHDYETFGIDPQRDRPSQFAGIRTDLEFNVIGDPLVIYCQPSDDYLPNPEACLLTGISPQIASAKGLVEAEFCRLIHSQLSQPNTCSLGYNTIRFDDEFTRNCLYRNFYDPYAREWQNGNSRWDLIDVVRATAALRPDGIHWPTDAEGRPNFKLTELTKVNGIAHEAAHDALSDVLATIALAKLIRVKQPKIFNYLWQHRNKSAVVDLIQLGSYQPIVHISGRFQNIKHCLAIVVPICTHPTNPNGIIVYDLSVDPTALITLAADDIKNRVFTSVASLAEGVERIPLKTVHINKSPVLAPISVLRTQDQDRLNIDVNVCQERIEQIKRCSGLGNKIADVFKTTFDITDTDPDRGIYSGGFFSEHDKHIFEQIRTKSVEKLTEFSPKFRDSRASEMYFRYRARNYPTTLSSEETKKWHEFCQKRLNGDETDGIMTFESFQNQINKLKSDNPEKKDFLDALAKWSVDKQSKLSNFAYH